MATLATIATVATLAAGAVSAAGTIAAGKAQAEQLEQAGIAQQQAAEFEAQQLEIRANEERAAAQQEAFQIRRQKRLALSQLQARAAGSGFSATDPTALALASEIETFGTLQEQIAMFGGAARQTNLRERAGATRFSGVSARSARFAEASSVRTGSRFSAAGTILGSIGTAAGRFRRPASPTPQAPAFAGRYG